MNSHRQLEDACVARTRDLEVDTLIDPEIYYNLKRLSAPSMTLNQVLPTQLSWLVKMILILRLL